ncbi:MAG TPA: hypothetical protein VE934_16280 [Polaromonas sp.]|uniref:hypothetical protein n=1 Tax=Polaromonas sp. TaxID=1869339 RepID=UPI002D47E815|nr:hypothetical protein [Polaromonas sp.]HYW58512.1 hypothetical protein [Polaromonas sp.]
MKEKSRLKASASVPVPPLTPKERSAPKLPFFSLGQIVATPDALAAMEKFGVQPLTLLQRHISGDWGELNSLDSHQNSLALVNNERLLSSYSIDGGKLDDPQGVRVWIITEWDRSVTTLLLPSDY